MRDLRSRIGHTRVIMPAVSAHIFDASHRLLLVRQREIDVWSTPGGAVDPDERPADAVVRETWEETGLVVSPRRLLAIYGGPEFVVRYANGDEVQYVIAAFSCQVIGGSLTPESDETVDARYWTEREAAELPLSAWLRATLPSIYAATPFEPPHWRPPA
jgi:ADP-ribose pyrophosphatase YjhB (NUDIX family)